MRTTTYTELLEAVAHGRGALPEDLNAADKARIAAALTRAYRHIYEAPLAAPGISCSAWVDLIQAEEVALTAGEVLWADVGNAVAVQCYTEQPVSGGQAQYVTELSRDNAGIRLDTTLSTVWARYVPAPPPAFTHVEYDAAATYAVGARIYYPPTGQQYECITATTAGQNPVSHQAKWRLTEIAYTLQEPVITYALSTYMGSEQERLQAKALSAQAEEQIQQLLCRHTSPL